MTSDVSSSEDGGLVPSTSYTFFHRAGSNLNHTFGKVVTLEVTTLFFFAPFEAFWLSSSPWLAARWYHC